MGIPSFLIVDYEHTHGRAARIADSTVMYPEVISRSALLRRGVRATRLVSFKGLKEDLTFANVDVNAIDPHELGSVPEDAVRVLFRPPSETSHYYRSASTKLAKATLAVLGGVEALVVFSPRERAQARLLDAFDWRHEPRVLERPVPFVSLLKSIDLVVCSGGTMLREAAYLGVPAYSIFQSEIGAVDRWLERLGRAKLIGHQDELHEIDLRRRGPLRRLDSNPELLDQLAGIISAGATERLADRTCVAA
jgi:predicted glycosyltransferase